MLYAAKCYWPGVTQADLESITERAAQADPGPGRDRVAYLGSLLFAADDLVLCLFQGPSRAAVIQASERLGIPSERLMEPTWLPPGQPIPPKERSRLGRGPAPTLNPTADAIQGHGRLAHGISAEASGSSAPRGRRPCRQFITAAMSDDIGAETPAQD